MIIKGKNFLILSVFCCFLVGCSHVTKSPIKNDPAVALVKKLDKFIVQIPHYSREDLVLIIPDDKLFNPNSANLTDDGLKIIKTVATLINCYEKEDVYVIGYVANEQGSDQVFKKSLAKEQAQKVINFLWKQNADMRITHVDGVLSTKSKYNAIEIRLRVFARQTLVNY